MKIALCIHGLYRSRVKPDPKTLHAKMRKAFPTADLYFHTWDAHVESIPSEFDGPILSCPEPVVDYHPVSDTKFICKHGKFGPYKQKKLNHGKMKNASKQLLGYADLVSKIDQEYDVFIRTRFDTEIADIDFTPHLQMAIEEGPVGFMVRPVRGQTLKEIHQVRKENPDKMDDWYGYLCDSMIFHSPRHFDPSLVNSLHSDRNLLPAEWGWYQVMSEPFGDIHTCFHGGAKLAR